MGRIPAAYYPYLHSIYVSSAWNANPTLPLTTLNYFFFLPVLSDERGKSRKISEKQGELYMQTSIIFT